MFARLIEQTLDFPHAAEVRPNGNAAPPELLNFLDSILRLRLRTPVMNHHIRALFRQPHRHRTSQALSRARNQSDHPCERSAFFAGSLRHGPKTIPQPQIHHGHLGAVSLSLPQHPN